MSQHLIHVHESHPAPGSKKLKTKNNKKGKIHGKIGERERCKEEKNIGNQLEKKKKVDKNVKITVLLVSKVFEYPCASYIVVGWGARTGKS